MLDPFVLQAREIIRAAGPYLPELQMWLNEPATHKELLQWQQQSIARLRAMPDTDQTKAVRPLLLAAVQMLGLAYAGRFRKLTYNEHIQVLNAW